jgi:CheY-like chemotaxis protein
VKPTPAKARVLIASDSVGDAQQIERLLGEHFSELRVSTNPDLAIQDFESYQPSVLVLAFDRIDKAQNYYLGLYRLTSSLPGRPHRTILLCTKEEVRTAFDLCVKSYFDDYVLFWPLVQDGLRLPMSVWIAARAMTLVESAGPAPAELRAHTKHLQTLETTFAEGWSTVEDRVGTARESVLELERNLAAASDEFTQQLVLDGPGSGVEVKDVDMLRAEVGRLKQRQSEQARRIGTEAIEPLGVWARGMKRQLEPALVGTRLLAGSVRKIPPVVMVIEDDELIHELIARALGPQPYQLHYVTDGTAAARDLQRVKPDVILMDIQLPGIDGITLTRRLKGSPAAARIPIIMMSGDSRAETLRASIEAGASAFVVKPFTTESLASKLEQVLSR